MYGALNEDCEKNVCLKLVTIVFCRRAEKHIVLAVKVNSAFKLLDVCNDTDLLPAQRMNCYQGY